jgi:hypothetical protein
MLCIGLAVGANAAVFALADALFLRPLDVPDADGLVTLASRPSDDDGRLSYQEFVDVRNEGRSFADLTALRPIRAGLAPSAQVQPEPRIGFVVTAGFFETVLGQDPGFRTDHRLTMRLDPSLAGYSPERTAQFYRTLPLWQQWCQASVPSA